MDLVCGILTKPDLSDNAFARLILDPLVASPAICPDRWGWDEPARTTFSLASLPQIQGEWPTEPPAMIIWRNRRKPGRSHGFASLGASGRHGSVSFFVNQPGPMEIEESGVVFRSWASSLQSDFGYLHLLTDEEVKRGIPRRTVIPTSPSRTSHDVFVDTRTLRRGIPDLYWSTAFGPSYRPWFSDTKLMSSPCYSVYEAGGAIVLQLTAKIEDMVADPVKFNATRDAVILHLGAESFLRGEGEEEQREAPLFRLPL